MFFYLFLAFHCSFDLFFLFILLMFYFPFFASRSFSSPNITFSSLSRFLHHRSLIYYTVVLLNFHPFPLLSFLFIFHFIIFFSCHKYFPFYLPFLVQFYFRHFSFSYFCPSVSFYFSYTYSLFLLCLLSIILHAYHRCLVSRFLSSVTSPLIFQFSFHSCFHFLVPCIKIFISPYFVQSLICITFSWLTFLPHIIIIIDISIFLFLLFLLRFLSLFFVPFPIYQLRSLPFDIGLFFSHSVLHS